MEQIITGLKDMLLPLKGVLIAGAALIVLMLLLRLLFGKNSRINRATSGAVGILLMYVVAMMLHCGEAQYDLLLRGLPLVGVSGAQIQFLSMLTTDFADLCAALLKTLVLALFVAVIDGWIPRKGGFIQWLLYRCLVVIGAGGAQLLVVWLFESILPPVVITYAPTILLCALVFTMLLGALKLLLGIALTVVNPVIGALYTFFFASGAGKTVSRAVMTTAILAVLLVAAEKMGYTSLSLVGANALTFLPAAAVLFGVWYIPTKLL